MQQASNTDNGGTPMLVITTTTPVSDLPPETDVVVTFEFHDTSVPGKNIVTSTYPATYAAENVEACVAIMLKPFQFGYWQVRDIRLA